MGEEQSASHRNVTLRILTQAGWVEGTMHLQAKVRVSEHFEREHEFVCLSDVKLEGKVERINALTLRRSSVLLILAGAQDPMEALHVIPTTEHAIECLLANGFVSGRLQLMKSVRLTDQLALRPSFFAVLRDVRIRLRDPWSNERIDLREPEAILNTQAIVGVREM